MVGLLEHREVVFHPGEHQRLRRAAEDLAQGTGEAVEERFELVRFLHALPGRPVPVVHRLLRRRAADPGRGLGVTAEVLLVLVDVQGVPQALRQCGRVPLRQPRLVAREQPHPVLADRQHVVRAVVLRRGQQRQDLEPVPDGDPLLDRRGQPVGPQELGPVLAGGQVQDQPLGLMRPERLVPGDRVERVGGDLQRGSLHARLLQRLGHGAGQVAEPDRVLPVPVRPAAVGGHPGGHAVGVLEGADFLQCLGGDGVDGLHRRGPCWGVNLGDRSEPQGACRRPWGPWRRRPAAASSARGSLAGRSESVTRGEVAGHTGVPPASGSSAAAKRRRYGGGTVWPSPAAIL